MEAPTLTPQSKPPFLSHLFFFLLFLYAPQSAHQNHRCQITHPVLKKTPKVHRKAISYFCITTTLATTFVGLTYFYLYTLTAEQTPPFVPLKCPSDETSQYIMPDAKPISNVSLSERKINEVKFEEEKQKIALKLSEQCSQEFIPNPEDIYERKEKVNQIEQEITNRLRAIEEEQEEISQIANKTYQGSKEFDDITLNHHL